MVVAPPQSFLFLDAAAYSPDTAASSTPVPPTAGSGSTEQQRVKKKSSLSAVLGTISSKFSVSPSSALVYMDSLVALPRQLVTVTLIAVFVLYPAMAAAALSLFACRTIDSGAGQGQQVRKTDWLLRSCCDRVGCTASSLR